MKLFKNKKKLNNKGFTLIELLAVIVILAIVMGISAQSVLRSINQSRVSSLLSTAQNAANQLNTWASEDALLTSSDGAHIGTGSSFYTAVMAAVDENGKPLWVCLSDTSLQINNGGSPIGILKALGLNDKDINVKNGVPTAGNNATRSNCSAVRYNNRLGAYEIFLSAGDQGKYYVAANGDNNFAYSRASATGEQLTD